LTHEPPLLPQQHGRRRHGTGRLDCGPKKAPYLYTLLNDRAGAAVLIVGIGVGLAAVLGIMRFIYGWSLKPLIYCSLAPTLLVSAYAQFQPELSKVIGLAWDCRGVTTGPVTVPLVLALGIGVASAVGKGAFSNQPVPAVLILIERRTERF